jgi:hypothetical protein
MKFYTKKIYRSTIFTIKFEPVLPVLKMESACSPEMLVYSQKTTATYRLSITWITTFTQEHKSNLN